MNKFVLSTLAALGMTIGSYAATPSTTSYQGILTDSKGNAVNGSHSVTFSLYTAAEGGSAVWSETKAVTVNNGLCATDLGSVKPLTDGIWSNPGLWLGVKVGSGTEMKPRTKILAVPYALRAKVAESVIGGSGSGLGALPVGTVLESTNPDDTVLKSAGFQKVGRPKLSADVEILSNPFPNISYAGYDLAYRLATSEDKLFAFEAGGEGKVYSKSSDSWSSINMSGSSISFLNINSKLISAGNYVIFFSSDTFISYYNATGDSWSKVDNTDAPPPSVKVISAQWANNLLYVLGDNQTVYSFNPAVNKWSSPIYSGDAPKYTLSSSEKYSSVFLADKILFYPTSRNQSGYDFFYFYKISDNTWKKKELPGSIKDNNPGGYSPYSKVYTATKGNQLSFAFSGANDKPKLSSCKISLDCVSMKWSSREFITIPEGDDILYAVGNFLVSGQWGTNSSITLVDTISGAALRDKTVGIPLDTNYRVIHKPVVMQNSIYSNAYDGTVVSWSEKNVSVVYRYVKQP